MFKCNCSDCGGPRLNGPCTYDMINKIINSQPKKEKENNIITKNVTIEKITYF